MHLTLPSTILFQNWCMSCIFRYLWKYTLHLCGLMIKVIKGTYPEIWDRFYSPIMDTNKLFVRKSSTLTLMLTWSSVRSILTREYQNRILIYFSNQKLKHHFMEFPQTYPQVEEGQVRGIKQSDWPKVSLKTDVSFLKWMWIYTLTII